MPGDPYFLPRGKHLYHGEIKIPPGNGSGCIVEINLNLNIIKNNI
jgi:hypothetical protein